MAYFIASDSEEVALGVECALPFVMPDAGTFLRTAAASTQVPGSSFLPACGARALRHGAQFAIDTVHFRHR